MSMFENFPDHDDFIGHVQSKVQEALFKVSRYEVDREAPHYGLSRRTLWSIRDWSMCSGCTFLLRTLFDAYDYAHDILGQSPSFTMSCEFTNAPDHDEFVGHVQSKVQEAMSSNHHLRVREIAKQHNVSFPLLYQLSRWEPESGRSFQFRKLLDAYDCALELLTNNQQTTNLHGDHR